MICTPAIVTNIIPYSESSLILKVFSFHKGQISIIAKGWLRKAERMQILRFCEYEFTLVEPKEEGLYLLKEAAFLTDFSQYSSSSTWATAECGAELLTQMIIPQHEAKPYYTLLCEYFKYLGKLEQNSVLILWRFWYRVFVLLGIPFDLSLCHECGEKKTPFAIARSTGDLLCQSCAFTAHKESTLVLSPISAEIISKLSEIGNHVDSFQLTRSILGEINTIFLSYYQAHQKQTLKLKSLSVLIQFYPKA